MIRHHGRNGYAMNFLFMTCTYIAVLFCVTNGLLPLPAVVSPATGDLNMMITAAVLLIAAFLIFVLLKNRRR